MYQTYTTDALVCGTYDRRTADRTYRLFTRELGMVWADARSVRLEKSKQRYALADFTLVRVSLVRGKAGWKIGSVASHTNYYHAATDQAARGSVVTFVRLLRRFVTGESADPELFDFVVASLLSAAGPVTDRIWFDQCVAARCLSALGYLATNRLPAEVQSATPEQLATTAGTDQAALVKLLKTAESASHL